MCVRDCHRVRPSCSAADMSWEEGRARKTCLRCGTGGAADEVEYLRPISGTGWSQWFRTGFLMSGSSQRNRLAHRTRPVCVSKELKAKQW